MTTVIVTGGEKTLAYRILEGEFGGRMVVEPVPERGLDEILAAEDARRMTPEEFTENFGHLPTSRND